MTLPRLFRSLLCTLGLATSVLTAASAPPGPDLPPADTVVLLHGLGRTRWSMAHLASALERDGYRVVNLTYPSRSLPLEALASTWLPAQLRAHGLAVSAASTSQPAPASAAIPAASTPPLPTPPSPTTPRVHFITHSMGGILLRLWLRDCGVPANLGRVVMLAPPNAGSELTDRLNAFAPFQWFTGANGRRLGTRPTDLPRTLGPWPATTSPSTGALGIIAADHSLNPLLSAWLPRPNDGKVTVASTRLAGMTDHLVLPFTHTWLAWHTETARQICIFLSSGHFQHPSSTPAPL